jgi:hypothetical protein
MVVSFSVRMAPTTRLYVLTEMFDQWAAEIPFTDGDLRELQGMLNADPTAGDLIPGAGGVRKVRAAAKGKGKRGGVRVIYYYVAPSETIYLLLVYAKGEWTDVSAEGRKLFKQLTKALDDERGERPYLHDRRNRHEEEH